MLLLKRSKKERKFSRVKNNPTASGADVDTVVINGKVVMENRQLLTINEEEVMQKVREIAVKVKKGLKK